MSDRQADSCQGIYFEAMAKQRPIACLPVRILGSEGRVEHVRSQQWIMLAQRIASIAVPSLVGWVVHHGCTNGVELNIALTPQQVSLLLHQ